MGDFSKGRRSTDTGEIWTCLHLEFRLPFGTSHPFRALVIKASCPPSLGTSTATKLLKGKIKREREKCPIGIEVVPSSLGTSCPYQSGCVRFNVYNAPDSWCWWAWTLPGGCIYNKF